MTRKEFAQILNGLHYDQYSHTHEESSTIDSLRNRVGYLTDSQFNDLGHKHWPILTIEHLVTKNITPETHEVMCAQLLKLYAWRGASV